MLSSPGAETGAREGKIDGRFGCDHRPGHRRRVGGGLAGQFVKTAGMALLPKLLSGAVGGIAGGSILGALLGGSGVDPTAAADAAAAAGSMDMGQLVAQPSAASAAAAS